MIINPHRFAPTASGTLDSHAADLWAAWAPYRLLGSFSSAYVRVRRASDDAEADCGSDAAIAAHCGASVGHIVTLYDQTGNGRHATTPSASAQPIIYNGTSLITVIGAKPSASFNGTSHHMVCPSISGSGLTTVEVFAAAQITADPATGPTSGPPFAGNTIPGQNEHYTWSDGNVYMGTFRSSRFAANPTDSLATTHTMNALSVSAGNLTFWINSQVLYNAALGSFSLADNGLTGYGTPTIARSGTHYLSGHIGAVLLYSAAKADRADIRAAIT